MNNDFAINGSPEILKQLKVNVLYLDNGTSPLNTYYNKGAVHTYTSAVEGYVLYINYNDALFFRAQCDLNPEYFDYSSKKSVTVEQIDKKFYANVVFLRKQEGREKRYDSSTQMVALNDALVQYQDEFQPVLWREPVSLEDKFKLTLPLAKTQP